ncbi:MAG TPA: shikimate dehydrogenase [Planctomycetota bacterium]|nr:shikimate dehydrogenase [Planctomycetota bacterium]
MIAATIRGPSIAEAAAQVEAARRAGADLAEIRLDLLERPDIGPFLEKKSLPVIATLRPAWEGGGWKGNEDDRIAILREAAQGGADWVDVEFRAYKDFDRGRARLVLSYHDPEKTPPDLGAVSRKMAGLEPDLLKVAVMARGTADVLAAVRAQRDLSRPGAVIPMGDWGEPARILYARLGGWITYAAAEAGRETAPGQPTVAELIHDYRVKSIDEATEVYAVFGNPVAHSQSPRLFNRVFQALGFNARYVKVRLDSAGLLREAMEVLGLRGGSVTIPHKTAALPLVEEPDERVRAIGAVNTVVLREGRIHGHNTDVLGAVESVQAAATRRWHHGVYGMRALVLGAGGVARAVAWGLKQEGARVTIANRTFDRGKALAEELGCDYLPASRVIEARAQVVANATSAGMGGTPSPFPKELWKREMVAFDVVYTPRRTEFLEDARAAGAEVADGVEMFLRQAVHQLNHYVGRGIPTEVIKEFDKTL